MRRPLTRAEAEAFRTQVLQLFCSSAWLDAVCPDPRFVNELWYDDEVFPPPGMVTCLGCQKRCPPNRPCSVCCDCEVEKEELDFLTQLAQIHDGTQAFEVFLLWWGRPILPATLATTPGPPKAVSDRTLTNAVSDWNAVDANERDALDSTGSADPLGDDAIPRNSSRLQQYAAWREMHYRLGLESTGVRFFDPISITSLSALPQPVAESITDIVARWDRQVVATVRPVTTALRRACEPLGDFTVERQRDHIVLRWHCRTYGLLRCGRDFPRRNTSIGSGRSSGCEFQLLSEQPGALCREIEAFQETGEVVRRARRFSRPNPLGRSLHPEDGRSVVACFVTLRRKRSQELTAALPRHDFR